MNRFFIICCLCSILTSVFSQQWQKKEVPIQTRWSKEVSVDNALREYPHPQMERENWQNLNGRWDYAITKKDAPQPTSFEGKILVPYPIESALSGVKKALQPEENLWYRRTFTNMQRSRNKFGMTSRTLLHFGAVDFRATVYINGKEAGTHEGGYTEFTFDITTFLKKGENELLVKVWDPSDEGYGPHGKQVLNPANIYYTPSSGIWQTVWLETVPETHIEGLKLTPDVDKEELRVEVNTSGIGKGYSIEVQYFPSGVIPTAVEESLPAKKKGAETHSTPLRSAQGDVLGGSLVLPIKNPHLWSPSDPYLYDLIVRVKKGNKVVDEVKSYFGMRKISVMKDEKGIDRIALNNQPYFNLGTLDQGFWPDGLYTAPTDEALKFDIAAIKAMGFNTIRKHIKIEPARWYYWADKLGMLVWQDFVNPKQSLPEGSKQAFEQQGAAMLQQLHNHPCITTWVLFNEKWGQYDQERLTNWVKQTDPTRLVNGHSGEYLYVNEKLRSPSPNAYIGADMTDVHAYPDPMNSLNMEGKAQVCGEFGGIGVFIPDHQWNSNSAWGYIQEKPAALAAKYRIMNQHLQLLKAEGLSGSIYTQPFDLEGEQNGLMTYDREVIKIPFVDLRKIHRALNPDAETNLPEVTAQNADLTEPAKIYADSIQEYINGKRDAAFLKRLTMLAGQTNDLAGNARFGNEYLNTLKEPYSADDIAFIEGVTNKVTDAGFGILVDMVKTQDLASLPASHRPLRTKLMNIIYTDVISPYVPTPDTKPNWDEIREKVKPYGAPGEEIYLRAKTIHLLNQNDLEDLKPVAKEYLEKYGEFIKPEEKKLLESKK